MLSKPHTPIIAAIAVIFIAVLLFGAAAYIFMTGKDLSTTDPSPAPTRQAQPPASPGLTVATEYDSAANTMTVYLEPIEGIQELSTFALKLDFSAPELNSLASSPAIGEEFTQANWRFPFASVKKESAGNVSFNISGIYASPQPYTLEGRQVLATFPVTTAGDSINILLDSTVSELYDKSATKYIYQLSSTSTPVNQ